MLSQYKIEDIANNFLRPKGLKITSCKILQNLWAGYGHICHIHAVPIDHDPSNDDQAQSLILKIVTPPSKQNGKHHHQLDEGHLRKLISYQVEQHFYTALAPRLPSDVAPVAKCIASINEQSVDGVPTIAMILTDLRESFPAEGEKRGELNDTQVYAALKWLAGFHGFWWKEVEGINRGTMRLPPLEEVERVGGKRDGVWLNGGYTYLATRQKEYNSLRTDPDSEWSQALCTPIPNSPNNKSLAELVAQILSPSATPSPTTKYETLIHGDVKSENLFTTSSGSQVAFFDFQYIGLGLGVCDLAKLFTCSVPISLLTEDDNIPSSLDMQPGEKNLLEYYQQTLERFSGKTYPWDVLVMHWKTALVDWLRFQASWGFWGNTEWLEARCRRILEDREWRAWVVETAEKKKA